MHICHALCVGSPLGPPQILLRVSPKLFPPFVCKFYRIWVVCTSPRGAKWERRKNVHYFIFSTVLKAVHNSWSATFAPPPPRLDNDFLSIP